MTDDTRTAQGITAQEFFAAGIEGGSMTDAHHATRIAYSTVHRASNGGGISVATARALETWSRALGRDLFISAAATLGIAGTAEDSSIPGAL